MVAMARCSALARYVRPVSNLESSAFTGGHSPSPRRLTAYGCTPLPVSRRQSHVVCCMHVASRPCLAVVRHAPKQVTLPALNLLSPLCAYWLCIGERARASRRTATQSGAVQCTAAQLDRFSRAHAVQVVRVCLTGFASYGERGHLGSLVSNACADQRHNRGIARPAAQRSAALRYDSIAQRSGR